MAEHSTEPSARALPIIWETVNYAWTVNNFSKLPAILNKAHVSPPFPENRTSKWRLNLYPKGRTEEGDGNVAIFVQLISSQNPEQFAQVRISMLDFNDYVIMQQWGKSNEFTIGSTMGYNTLLKRELLAARIENNDIIKINIGIRLKVLELNSCHEISCNGIFFPDVKPIVDLKTLFESQGFSDVVLCVKDGVVKAHKNILAARSTVFAAMFAQDVQPTIRGRVTLTGMDMKMLSFLVNFIYTGEVGDWGHNKVIDILEAAHKFGLDDLKELAAHHLAENLHSGTAG